MIQKADKCVIFVASKHHVELLRMILLRFNFDPCYIYSSLDPFARKEMIRKFRQEDSEHNIMLVTDIAARGIDIPLLDCVVNFHFPPKVSLLATPINLSKTNNYFLGKTFCSSCWSCCPCRQTWNCI